MKYIIQFVLFITITQTSLFAQQDTLFWFVAPEITKGQIGYDNPTVFRISAFSSDAIVTVSMPANPAFPAQQLNVAAGSTAVLDMANWVETIENKPANQVLNKGILIHSTQPISIYYEVIGQLGSNPEIFALKGFNALGKRFYTPFQSFLDNSNNPGHTPFPHAAFDLVATEDNTSVTITPTRALVGHAANIPFTITLNRGQTFSCEAASQSASQHPSGSLVVSDKPVAITVKDDLLDAPPVYGGFCRDLVGDQIIPVDYVGKRYVVSKGELDGPEVVVIVATENGTTVFHNNTTLSLNAGETGSIQIDFGSHFITGNKPFYVFHISGIGCEVAGEIMPSLDCSGSQSVRFIRTNNDPLFLHVVTRAGNENAFRINGNPNLLPATLFDPVPGSNGEFVSAVAPFLDATIPAGVSTLIETINGGLFHAGFINGLQNNGCAYGFFSDFLNKVVVQDSVSFCEGDTVLSHGLEIWQPGDYQVITDNELDCDTIFNVKATWSNYQIVRTGNLPWCPGDTITVYGQDYIAPGIYTDTLLSQTGACDTLLIVDITPTTYIHTFRTYEICSGDSILIGGVFIHESAILLDTLLNDGIGCDTIVKIMVNLIPPVTINQTIVFCQGDTLLLGGMIFTEPFLFVDTIEATTGCIDTVLVITGNWLDVTEVVHIIRMCPSDSIFLGGQYYRAPASFILTPGAGEACDSIHRYDLYVYPDDSDLLITDSIAKFCTGNPIVLHSPYPGTIWNNQIESADFDVKSSGIVTVRFTDENGCVRGDTITILPCCNLDNVFIPNVFHPGNPPNDRFNISTNPVCIPLHMRIYDRWGQFIYQTDNPVEKGWDGKFRGQYCSPGVYIWVLEIGELGSTNTSVLKGDVTIVR